MESVDDEIAEADPVQHLRHAGNSFGKNLATEAASLHGQVERELAQEDGRQLGRHSTTEPSGQCPALITWADNV